MNDPNPNRKRLLFLCQALVSTAPAIVLTVSVPLFASRLSIPLSHLAYIFLIMRLVGLFSPALAPYLLSSRLPHKVCSCIELLNVICALAALMSLRMGLSWLPFVIFPLRTLCSTLLSEVRRAWLKQLPSSFFGQDLLVSISSIQQGSAGLAGILMILGLNAQKIEWLLWADGLSSLAGIWMFIRMQSLHSNLIKSHTTATTLSFQSLVQGSFRKQLFITDILFSVAFSGTHIFILRSGTEIFQRMGGFGTTLAIYGGGFLMGGLILRDTRLRLIVRHSFTKVLLPLMMAVCLVIVLVERAPIFFRATSFLIFFLMHPLVALDLELLWFENVERMEIARTLGARSVCVGLIYAAGEKLSSLAPITLDLYLRAACLVAVSLTLMRVISLHGSAGSNEFQTEQIE